MKKILAAAVVAAAMSGTAFAADLGYRKPTPVIPIIPVFTWTGFYAGVNVGYAFDHNTRFTNFNGTGTANGVGGAAAIRPGVVNLGTDGITAGGQVGYNYQFGAGNGFVVGVEADIAYTDLGRTAGVAVGGFTSLFNANLDYLGTVRGRVGYAFDRFLVYGTGGFAFGDVSTSTNFLAAAGAPSSYYNRTSSTETGFAVGGGAEYALPTDNFLNFFRSSAITIKGEYLYYDLGSRNVAIPATGLTPGATGAYTQRIRTDGSLFRVGLNYKF